MLSSRACWASGNSAIISGVIEICITKAATPSKVIGRVVEGDRNVVVKTPTN